MKFIKKLLLTIPIIFNFNAYSAEISNNNRIYIGGGIGNTDMIGTLNHRIVKLTDKTIKLGNRTTVIKFLIGYGFILEGTPLYFGIESSYQLGNIELEREISAHPNLLISSKINKKDTIGLHAKLGISKKRILFYIKGGSAYSIFQYTLVNKSGSLSFMKRLTNKYGISGGIGVSYSLNDHWKSFMEYEITKYPQIKFNLHGREEYKFQASTYTFMTGILYLF